jgi:hypothetical protein
MKTIDIRELVTAVPVTVRMTRRERLLHWAHLLRSGAGPLALYHGLEWMSPAQLTTTPATESDPSAFGVALADPVFREQGLPGVSTIGEVMRFFELSQQQLHEFSCDCGGAISRQDMADRIEWLAG